MKRLSTNLAQQIREAVKDMAEPFGVNEVAPALEAMGRIVDRSTIGSYLAKAAQGTGWLSIVRPGGKNLAGLYKRGLHFTEMLIANRPPVHIEETDDLADVAMSDVERSWRELRASMNIEIPELHMSQIGRSESEDFPQEGRANFAP